MESTESIEIQAFSAEPQHAPAGEEVVVRSPRMRSLYAMAARLARTDLTVLIQGETGSGKELVARALHAQGRRKNGPFHAVNCGALPETLIESVLFGHERGAFTGAHRRQSGAFESAQGGTLFLDEVGELSASAQAALLRALETRRIQRIGGDHEVPIDVRVVAATHRDLSEMVAQGRFRADLLYRLNGITLKVPALRERPEEIEALAEHFAHKEACGMGRPTPRFDASALEVLRAHSWPGNVRELHNAIMRALVHSDGEVIRRDDLPYACSSEDEREAATDSMVIARPLSSPIAENADSAALSFRTRVAAYERKLLEEALAQTRGNRKRAAKLLELPLRTFLRKLSQHRSAGMVLN